MRFLAWLVGVPVAALLVLFAVSNRDPVSIGLWPFTEGVTAPSFVVALVPFVLGLLLGLGYGSIGAMRARWRHRRADRKVHKMEEELTAMRSKPQPAPRPAAIAGPDSSKTGTAPPS
jgi:uncharacterized integral membrane protein